MDGLCSAWAHAETISESDITVAAKRLIEAFHSIEPWDRRACSLPLERI